MAGSIAALACAAAPGCKGGGQGGGFSLQSAVRGMFGPSPNELVAMAFDPNDADNRRVGIARLSDRAWGRQEPYLKGYATIARTDPNPLVRSVAVRALGRAGDPNYVGAVAAALDDRETAVRVDAAAALDSLRGPAAVGPLRRRAVADDSEDVRALCCRALRHYRRDDVLATLARCLADKTFTVRWQAHASLVELTGRDLGFEAESWADVRADAASRPAPASRPWWDLMGVTGKKR